MQIKAHKDEAQAYQDVVGEYRTGIRNTKTLLTGREGALNNYKLAYGGEGSETDWVSPRHRHTFEQIRYTACGEYVMRPGEVLPAGWVAYFPESVHYGPQVKAKDCSMLTMQYGGPSGRGYWSIRQRKAAYDALIARGGKFVDGMYQWADADGKRHNQDAAEATEEEAFKRKVVYPEPRYHDIVTINPASFDWKKDRDMPGVARKLLGVFTERDVRVAFVRVEKGATLQFGFENAPETMFLKEGRLTYQNMNIDPDSAFATETEEAPASLTAIEPSELIYIKLPTF